jgi:HNH endonuclease
MLSVTAFGHVANPTTSVETFKPIPGFPGYSVSEFGTVRGPRATTMSPADNGTGYLQVILYRHGKPHRRYVHRLVLMAHVGLPPSPTHQAAHWPNADRSDNRLENLRWATPRENAADKRRAATTPTTLH